MKYVFRKVLAGVLIFVCISFIKSCNVNALQVSSDSSPYPTIFVGYKNYVNNDDIVFFSDNINYVNINSRADENDPWGVYSLFDIPSHSIMQSFFIDYSQRHVSVYNESNDIQYLDLGKVNDFFSKYTFPISSTCPFSSVNKYDFDMVDSIFMTMKNTNILSCTYVDENGDVQTCVDRLSYVLFYGSNNNFLVSRNNNTYIPNNLFYGADYEPTSYESDTYYKNNWYYINENYVLVFKMDAGKVYRDIKISIGGIGNFNGNLSNLNSFGNNNNVNNYYLNYQLINGCTYGNDKLTFATRNVNDSFTLSNGSYITSSQYNNYVSNGKVIEITQSSVDNLINSQEAYSELSKEFAMQDRLIDYNVDTQDTDDIDFADTLFNSMNEVFGSSLDLFTNLIAVPVDLLNENADYGLFNEVVPGAGGWGCTSYVSSYLNQPYNQVSSEVNLTMPFTGNQFSIDCMDVDVLSPHNGLFNETLSTLYHIILTGLLSYWVIIGYFKLIKETYDPEDNSIEVMDL